MITLPNEYLSLSDDRLFAIAKIMYDRSVSALFYSKDYNENFFQDEDEIRLMIDMFLCSMCRVDGDINEKEKSFLSFLDAQCSDPEMASELSTAFDNNVAELLPFFLPTTS